MEIIDVITQNETSAGGVAYRVREDAIDVALISVGPSGRWQLPKGTIDPGETAEITAQREVREEAGVATEVLAPIETIEYWYQTGEGETRTRHHKFVQFFLQRYISGDPKDHDSEVNEARWVTINQAVEMLSFPSERKVLERARQLLSEMR